MCLKDFNALDKLPRFKSRSIAEKHAEKFKKPFQCLFYAAGFNFSHGSLLTKCGYTDEVDNLFFGEELFQMLKMHREGYQMYSPCSSLVFHLWDR
mmetsp:Transcript_26272/g.35069  ORF Transcript_26272/g.35069 Transcript_26272/m.35069 type:complete len:95 (-) Transcript_26272:204-488(-)